MVDLKDGKKEEHFIAENLSFQCLIFFFGTDKILQIDVDKFIKIIKLNQGILSDPKHIPTTICYPKLGILQ